MVRAANLFLFFVSSAAIFSVQGADDLGKDVRRQYSEFVNVNKHEGESIPIRLAQTTNKAPLRNPTPKPTRAPTDTQPPTQAPTDDPTYYPTADPTSTWDYPPTNAPVQVQAQAAEAAVSGSLVGIIVGVWAAFCLCAGAGYYYYKRLQKKIAEADAMAGDYVVTSEDSGYEDEAGVTKFVEIDEGVSNPLQFAGTTEGASSSEGYDASATVNDDDEFLADEDLL